MEKNNNTNNKILWRPALEVFSEISTWIAAPVILAVIVGKALDKRYDTAPLILLGLAVVAFLISAFGIIRAVKKYSRELRKEENNLNIK